MNLESIPTLLACAWLVPLASFALIWVFGPRLGHHGKNAGYIATGAILGSFLFSAVAMATWVGHHGLFDEHAHVEPLAGDWYTLGEFGRLRLTVGYYIDALTVVMFCMVTLIATCIHFYAQGYMHDELHDVDDHEVTLSDGYHLHRPGRYHRFFQYLSLFCFSMLGIVIAGNLAMVFVFWELVGVCSYFLIGFYIERKSASTAANKAFIVNRIGDFGMLIGLMALWGSMGTLHFGDVADERGQQRLGIFSQLRPGQEHHPAVPDGMVRAAAAEEVAEIVADHRGQENMLESARSEVASRTPEWREEGYGYGLLVVAGLGIFCGCVGKSAQFPLHTWLPDAMEGPTPVSALVHSATMVAAGVYLAGRFYPAFTAEVLVVIAVTGCITLFMAATIAITATDIKRVLAYSTVSQLGYMMFSLGVGGWVAGMLHLITHALFKSLLFLCSGSVIHAVHTNEMTAMGGLRKKMPYTAYTMLVGCLAIIGAGIPGLIGLSGYYSKDAILAQALSFKNQSNPAVLAAMFFVAAGGAAITAFYMFRMWFMTFTGEPRDKHRYDHAHESPPIIYVPLIVLAVFAVAVVWPTFESSPLVALLEQAVPESVHHGIHGVWASVVIPAEHDSHAAEIHNTATFYAFSMAAVGVFMATMFYGLRYLDPGDVRRQFGPIYTFLRNKWYFDEIYDFVFVRPTLALASAIAWLDRNVLDWVIDGLARLVVVVSKYDDWFDRLFVDGLVNGLARLTYSIADSLRGLQTGRIRQYVMFVVVATVALFVLVSFYR